MAAYAGQPTHARVLQPITPLSIQYTPHRRMKRNLSASTKPTPHDPRQLDALLRSAAGALQQAAGQNAHLRQEIQRLSGGPQQTRGDTLRQLRGQTILHQQREYEVQEKMHLLQAQQGEVFALETAVEARLEALNEEGCAELEALRAEYRATSAILETVNTQIEALAATSAQTMQLSAEFETQHEHELLQNQELQQRTSRIAQDLHSAQRRRAAFVARQQVLARQVTDTQTAVERERTNAASQLRQMDELAAYDKVRTIMLENGTQHALEQIQRCQLEHIAVCEEVQAKVAQNEDLRAVIDSQADARARIAHQIRQEQERGESLQRQQEELERRTRAFCEGILGRPVREGDDLERALERAMGELASSQ
ncbi:hypothetical protein SS50377_22615 [Spironucleus salmonicida]|uniref:Uncharacterized protein n=1 Tax=Spironucleus salmonicida TaxID=348837 RepID=V6LSS7_9EUKA|nr:hypothetical protein SS50377_22615 [Spironucleus salmonicida]|eukprot:EST47303.1 Hypothetical protein SS50377_12621 [Spironucleus salmonicida]